jgi:hypothetical protein
MLPARETQMEHSPKLLFVLYHSYVTGENDPDTKEAHVKTLFYSFSKAQCEQQIEFYATLPGFRDHLDGFRVTSIELDTRCPDGGITDHANWSNLPV